MSELATNGVTRNARTSKPERRADGFLHRFIDTGEVRLHVAEARPEGMSESSDVPLIVFLHGFPEYWWSWRHQLEAMAQAGYWAVAPDMRGYNESDKPSGTPAYEIEKLAADVAGVIHALGRKKAIVVGHDWGAAVAWAFANEHPHMLERLAVLNVPHPLVMAKGLRRPKQLKKSWYIFFFQLPRIPERTISRDDFAFIRRTFRADGVPAEDIEHYVDAMRIPNALTSAINYYRAALRRVVTGRLPKMHPIEQRVLVVWGDRDRYLGSDMAEPPRRFVPHARVVHIKHATHWVQNDAAEKVNDLLLEFIRERV